MLLYLLEQGPTEKGILEQCYRQRLPIPNAIANAPDLWLGLELYFDGFLALTTCRRAMDGPISWFDIDAYCDKLLLEEDQREDMHAHIPAMDEVYLDFKAKQLKKRTAAQPSAPRKLGRR